MVPSNPIDATLDSLLWVAATAFGFSLVSHLLRLPGHAFIFGALSALGAIILMAIASKQETLRTPIVYRAGQVVVGCILGVLA